MSLFEICILVFLGFIIVYEILDRICKCIENVMTLKHGTKIIYADGSDINEGRYD